MVAVNYPQITILRCDPIDQEAALDRMGHRAEIWSLALPQNLNSDVSVLDRLIQPIQKAIQHGGSYVWRNYLSIAAVADPLTQQIIWDLLRELCFTSHESPCKIAIVQTDRTPVPESISFFVREYVCPLPTTEEIQKILLECSLAIDDRMVRLSTGMSHADLERCLTTLDSSLDPYEQIERYRSQRLALKGIKYAPPPKYQEIGGLDLLKKWIEDLEYRLSPAAEAIGLPFPRGVLFAGVPGTGKTFAANAIAAMLGYPIFSFSMDAVQAGGAKVLEEQLRIIESCAPCILFADEIEKLFNGVVDGRILATFLSWLNDKQAKVFVIGTLNRIVQMPVEMMRSGRFDRVFFIDSPDEGQRVELCRLFLKRYDRRFANETDSVYSPEDWQSFADATIEFIGAEIQQIVQDTVAVVRRENPDREIAVDDLLATAIKFNSMYKRDPLKVADIRNALVGKADSSSSGSRLFLGDRELDIWQSPHS
jgi:SpoVK/Ycf46/Vps4 family AAA+-type ATPase